MGKMVSYNKICLNSDSLGLIHLHANNEFGLARGQYVFVDLFCDNPDCDCKGGMVDVYKVNKNIINAKKEIIINKLPLATFSLSWKNIHDDWSIEIHSSPQRYNTAKALLEFFKRAYKEELAPILKRHYVHYKQTIKENNSAIENIEGKTIFPEEFKKIGRNDLCPCGSGKKCMRSMNHLITHIFVQA